jgi:hypothetical protein
VNDIALREDGIVSEPKDVLVVIHISNMVVFNVHVAEFSFVEKEKANEFLKLWIYQDLLLV